MNDYIKARLERAEWYFNRALDYSTGAMKPAGQIAIIKAQLNAGMEQINKIERYIHQCGTQATEDSKYHSIIE